MADGESYRQELREAVMSFACGQTGPAGSMAPVPSSSSLPSHINLYLFGPQGSGKTSFVRSCFRALYGRRRLENTLNALETTLQRSDDGTSMYSVFSLTDRVCLHDTRGQREYTPEEMSQLKLVLEGRARPNTLIQQRRRYWLLLREFWRTDDQMRRTFSKQVMLPKASLDTEPHFSFLVLDPNQQELLLEDEDFRMCYSSLIGDFNDRRVPFALLCTHGDTLTARLRAELLRLPEKLGCRAPVVPGAARMPPPQQQGPGGVLRPSSFPRVGGTTPSASSMSPGGPQQQRAVPAPPPAAPSPFGGVCSWSGNDGPGASPSGPSPGQPSPPEARQPQRMPDVMRIVTNYVDASPIPGSEQNLDGNDVQQDIHTLLVLLDALRQADHQIMQRITGKRPAPMPAESETGCRVL
mmetsp:Transcript_9940/g.26302  ORF Transcript_9940/g.26302 Transcript_9940/m.26302 type:complete len:410 (-) Transcript_9940:62-1291(-)